MSYSKGIFWLDDCRIPFVDEKDPSAERYKYIRNVDKMFDSQVGFKKTESDITYKEQQGRFTPNLLVCDDMLNDGSESIGFSGGGGAIRFAGAVGGKKLNDYNYYGDKGSNSRYYSLDLWFNKMVDEL